MATEKLTLLTEVKGATTAAREIGKIEGAVDRVGTKVTGLRGKLGQLGGRVAGFLDRTGLGLMALNVAGDLGAEAFARSNAGTGGPAGVAGNVLGAAASGAAIAGPLGAAAGIAVGTAKAAAEIGQAANEQGKTVAAMGREFLELNPTIADLDRSIAGIDQGLMDLARNPLTVFAQDAVKELAALRQDYAAQRDALLSGFKQPASISNEVNVSVNATVPVSVNVPGQQRVTYLQRKVINQKYTPPPTQTIPGYTNPFAQQGIELGEG